MAIEPTSPANAVESPAARRRIPMSVPQQKLAVPEIPGYHQHWMIGRPERIQQALNAGYEFVSPSEVVLNSRSIGGDSVLSGNTDLGDKVSVVAGEEIGSDGQPIRLYLMKLKEEWYTEDLAAQEASNQKLINTLRKGAMGAEREVDADAHSRYVDPRTKTDLFTPKPIRRS